SRTSDLHSSRGAMMAQSPWQVGSELEWDHYAEQMHRYRCGERRGKPRVPWQYGTHINSLPIEHNAPSANRQRRRRASTSCWPVWRHRVMADRLRTMPRVSTRRPMVGRQMPSTSVAVSAAGQLANG